MINPRHNAQSKVICTTLKKIELTTFQKSSVMDGHTHPFRKTWTKTPNAFNVFTDTIPHRLSTPRPMAD